MLKQNGTGNIHKGDSTNKLASQLSNGGELT
jgi:hypothetical protein